VRQKALSCWRAAYHIVQDSGVTNPRPDDDKWLAQMRRGSLELCILAILDHGRRYGYDIVQALSHSEGLVIKEGTIYPLLNRLEGEGLVSSEWQPSPEGPARRYYTLTDVGRDRLPQMRAQWLRFADDVRRILESAAADTPRAASR
jgi:PadR family transcriptional regulator PadR